MKANEFDAVLGIDPGSQGGISVYRNGKADVVKMPKKLEDIREYLQYIKSVSKHPIVFLEKLQLRMDDINDNPGKAFRIQKLLMAFQQLKDFIQVEGIPFVLVHPMSWQSYLKLRRQAETKTERKNRYKDAAGIYYPTIKPTLWNADALLIMHFGRLKLHDDPNWVKANLPSEIIDKLNFDV